MCFCNHDFWLVFFSSRSSKILRERVNGQSTLTLTTSCLSLASSAAAAATSSDSHLKRFVSGDVLALFSVCDDMANS